MQKSKKGIFALLLITAAVFAFAGSALATEVLPPAANTYIEVENFINTYDLGTLKTWQTFMFEPWAAAQFKAEFEPLYGKYFTHEQLDEFYRLLEVSGSEAALAYAATFLRVPGGDMTTPESAPQRVADVMLRNVIMPPAVTRQQKAVMGKERVNTRFIGGDLRYENIDTGTDRDGHIPGLTAGMAWDQDQFSYGFMIPYDHLDMDGWNANRFGLIGFGSYHRSVAPDVVANGTGYLHYMYLDPDDFDAVNYYGFGLSGSISYDRDWIVPGASLTYQFTKDDTDRDDDVQQLIKVGANCGFRFAQNTVVNVYLIYNKDVSSDLVPGTDTSFVDLGLEVGYSVTDTFGVNIGYKSVQEYDDYDSDTIYIGTLYQW